MNTKAFISLLVGVLVLGGSIGGAFVGGMALGESRGEEVARSSSAMEPTSGLPEGFQGQFSQEQLDQLRQRFQDQLGEGAESQGFAGLAGLTGTVEKVEGNTVTVNTAQGPLQATIGADTIIQSFTEGTLADLETGTQVTVTGQRGEDGTVEARSILITPEGAVGFPGGRFFPGGR